MENCSRCSKSLTFLNRRKVRELEVCSSCLRDIQREVIEEKVSLYLKNKKDFFPGINKVFELFNKDLGLFKKDSLEKPKRLLGLEYFYLTDKESLKRLQAEKGLDNVAFSKWKSLEISKINLGHIFLEDLEKLRKLILHEGVKADFDNLMKVISDHLTGLLEDELDKTARILADGVKKLLGEGINKENSLKTLVRTTHDSPIKDVREEMRAGGSNPLFIKVLTEHLGFKTNESEVSRIVSKELEEIELEDFKEGMSSQKQGVLGDFSGLNGFQFQTYLKNLFEALGYLVEELPLSGDQGADLVINKNDERVVIQAKKYVKLVPNNAIQEVVASKEYYKANGAIVVTDNEFTKSAIALAESNNVELWDGNKLREVISEIETKAKPYRALDLNKLSELKTESDPKVVSAREKAADTLFKMSSMVGLKPGDSKETIIKKLVEAFKSQSRPIGEDSLPIVKIMSKKYFGIDVSIKEVKELINRYKTKLQL